MRKEKKLWNKKVKKIAYFISREKDYVRVNINGLDALVKNEDFDKYYEKLND